MHRIHSLIIVTLAIIVLLGCKNNPSGPHNDLIGSHTLFVLNANSQTVSKINLDSATVTNDFAEAGDVPADIATYGSHLLILNSTPPSLEIANLSDGTITQTVNLPLNSNPYQLLVDQDAIYVTGWLSNQLYLINGLDFSLIDSVEVGVNPQGMISNSDYVFVANSGGYPNYTASSVSVINKSDLTVARTLPVSMNPQNFTWGPFNNLHVVCTGNYATVGGKVDIIDPAGLVVVDSLLFGGTPGFIAMSDQGYGYLTDFGNQNYGFLYEYDALSASVIYDTSNPIQLNTGAMDAVYDSQTSHLFVANFSAATVQEISTKNDSLVQTYVVGDGPQNLTLWHKSL